jgi:tRNA(Ile)-lysidine synthase
MPKYLVAVSGGVDSVVLLDALSRHLSVAGYPVWGGREVGEIIVAHFDHGIRDDSAEDAEFVAELAKSYGHAFRMRREDLGTGASEETARHRRYAFLKEVCNEEKALLVTAHHGDDAVETVAINMTRGTGWRGLAVLDTRTIWRPLLAVTKQEIREYANLHKLTWREDSTNSSDLYLRNRLRRRLSGVDVDTRQQILALRARQTELKRDIDDETRRLIGQAPYSRYFFTHINDMVAVELLRALFVRETSASPTIPARKRALHAIKVAKQGATIDVADGVRLYFTRSDFVVQNTEKVISL